MAGRGGPRHFAKPYLDAGLLFKALDRHSALLTDMKGYEVLSSNSGVDPKALHYMLPLIDDLVALEASASIAAQPLRTALFQVLQEEPSLNSSKYKGSVWVNMRVGRLGVVLHHVRKLARTTANNAACLANLTSLEYAQLMATLKKVVVNDPQNVEKAPLKKGTLKKDAESSLKNESPPKKRLKETPSNVSVDSNGWPQMLRSPAASPASSAKPPNLFEKRRRIGSRAMQGEASEGDTDLHLQMGLRKKPAAALKKSKAASKKGPLKKGKPAASKSSLKKGKAEKSNPLKKDAALKKERLPWVKLLKTTSIKSERCYLTGTHEKNGKPKLIVEVTKRRSLQYHWVIDSIMKALKKDNLTKEEALQMREDLCAKFP